MSRVLHGFRWSDWSARWVLAMGLWSALAAGAAELHRLEFVTQELPPMNFSTDGRADGHCSDIVRELLRRTGLQAPITVLPWARAYKLAETEPNVGLYCTARTEAREKSFVWVGPLANLVSALYATADSDLRLTQFSDAKNARNVVVLNEGYNAQLLKKRGFTNVIFANNHAEAVRLLLVGGNKTLLMVPTLGIRSTLARLELAPDAIKPIFTVMKVQAYVAFSKATDPALISRLQAALDDMKRDGSFNAIHRKWFPGETVPGIEREPDIPAPEG